MRESVRQRLTACLEDATKAERTLASYMLANLKSLPFETAATLAEKVGLSEPSVGRFCRSIGYEHFKGLKADLKADIGDGPWLIGDRLKDYRERSRRGNDELARGLEMEIAALVNNYEMARSKEWKRAARRLAHIPTLYVAGFQTERGLAQYMVNQLHYLRPGVHLADLAGGNFSDVLLGEPRRTNLVIIEARRYSRLARLLAIDARAQGIATTLITDKFCDWAHDVVDEVFAVETDINQFWDSTPQFASLIALMINSIFNELGPDIEGRMNKVAALYSRFTGRVGDPGKPDS
ncbi:MurR/RpiR family transcriptional regulator [Taklimakanibacter deserti]|uniref:MurR/RpiR family transcriptional regulator n=1 Tax=Taklimakanibacter deserti TaxID=2267839 RepID=UPI000E647B01